MTIQPLKTFKPQHGNETAGSLAMNSKETAGSLAFSSGETAGSIASTDTDCSLSIMA